ncbi:hypothetical protein NUW54_g6781 [Trametes sanguinea]|uniref:Uncharacterized protein n=1 Tax=Trametes sanguinea TaxID=158606 RepID=A0ACC1PSR4_9APHY|nr:hypothetical protein NUW54_g6781 [Trametes sanguinea]
MMRAIRLPPCRPHFAPDALLVLLQSRPPGGRARCKEGTRSTEDKVRYLDRSPRVVVRTPRGGGVSAQKILGHRGDSQLAELAFFAPEKVL